MLRKYLRDPENKVDLGPIRVQQDLTIQCRPMCIMDSSKRVMRRRTIKYVKVLWANQTEREATWELEEQICKEYPELLEIGELCLQVLFCSLVYLFYHGMAKFGDEFFYRGRM
jgi:hypothetical protein